MREFDAVRRCFVCRAAMLTGSERRLTYPGGRVRAFGTACGSCGVLLVDREADSDACWAHLAAGIEGDAFTCDAEAPYGLDLYTLRIAATRLSRGIRAHSARDRAELLAPHGTTAARAELYELPRAGVGTVSLGLPCRPTELAGVLSGLSPHAVWTDDVAILVDGEAAAPRPVPVAGFADGAVRIAARPLRGDFSAQRNALQALARRPWMLQLDADEVLAPRIGTLLPALAGLAKAGQVRSIGLARENRVDGILSDVYPDVQYRLNRADMRFRGRVHERPEIGWQASFIALHGAIEHRLSRTHVLSRSRRYEAMDPGHGRPEEEEALLRPYRD